MISAPVVIITLVVRVIPERKDRYPRRDRGYVDKHIFAASKD